MANLNFFAKNLKFFPKNLKFPFRGLFPFSTATLRLSERDAMPRISTAEREQGRCDSSKGTNFARVLADIVCRC